MSDELTRRELARQASEKLHAAEVEYQAAVMTGVPDLYIPAAAHVKRARQELEQVTQGATTLPGPPVQPAGHPHPHPHPLAVAAPPPPPPRPERVVIATLTGSREQADWLEAVHLKTGLSRPAILQSALGLWAAVNGHPPLPLWDDD